MRRGAAAFRAAGGTLISNTVVCKDNAAHLPAIAALLIDLGVVEAQFWSFLHIGDAGQEDQLVAIAEAEPPLREAIAALRARSIPVTVKWFPACRLEDPSLLDNHQPQMLIRDEFQIRLSDGFRFGCTYAASCRRFGRGCDGLHEGYVRRFGDERALLRPM
jgi:MoaA/NifB/PqqE/SkfB family radical SAM enzyme